MEGHACPGKSCIFCALKVGKLVPLSETLARDFCVPQVIFTQYQHGEEPALPPLALRTALATYFEVSKLQLNTVDKFFIAVYMMCN